MLDPGWTPQRGYSHAASLLAIISAAEQKKQDALLPNDQAEDEEEASR